MVGSDDLNQVKPILTPDGLLELRYLINQIKVREEIIGYIAEIIKTTREHPLIQLGASPRAGVHLLLVSKAYASLQGRDYLTPDDIQEVIHPVLRHRLLVKPEAQIDGKTSDLIINNILSQIKVPR
jgi:MoxR-like ATPase